MVDSGLIYFKEKFKLGDPLIDIFQSFFDKLVDFGYIGKNQKRHLIDNLNENVKEFFIGNNDPFDYKSGYYDANRKILYIKDVNDVSSIYLRLLYAVFTTEIDETHYSVGFGFSKLGRNNYKLVHENFAFNRAVFSNITCKLLGDNEYDLKISPTYKTYSKDFLGHSISSTNDIYYLEGKILSELCFALDIDENLIYSCLFANSPVQELSKIFAKADFDKFTTFLSHFDKISRKYSNYCKLNYFSKLLNLNYIELRKNVLNNNLDSLKKEREKIIISLSAELESIVNTNKYNSSGSNKKSYDNINDPDDIPLNLNETLEHLEDDIIKELVLLQNILADKIITSISYMSPYKYACKLKIFNSMLIIPSSKINDAIYNTIIFKLMPDGELTAVNIIQKIRYSLINNILFYDKYTDISKKIGFYLIPLNNESDDNSMMVIVTANNNFAYLSKVSSLDKRMKKLSENCETLKAENLRYLLNSDFSNMYVDKIEKIVSTLKEAFPVYKNVSLDAMYLYSLDNIELLIINSQGITTAFTIEYRSREYKVSQIRLSDYFSLFYGNARAEKDISLLPTTYKRRNKLFK